MNRSQRRALCRRCDEVVIGLPVGQPFNLEKFCIALGERRRRPLRVLPHPVSSVAGLPCGVWMALPDKDVIFIDSRTSRVHQEHIGLHEVAHILCGHTGRTSVDSENTHRLLPNLDPAMVQRVLGRTSYGRLEEQEAEFFATLLGQRLAGASMGGGAASDSSDEQSMRALAQLGIALRGGGGED